MKENKEFVTCRVAENNTGGKQKASGLIQNVRK